MSELTQAERDFLTTWLFEIGTKPVFFWLAKKDHPATYGMWASPSITASIMDKLKELGYLETSKDPNMDSALMLTAKAINYIGETNED